MKSLTTLLAIATVLLGMTVYRQRQTINELTVANAAMESREGQLQARAESSTAPELSAELLNELMRLRAESEQRRRESPRHESIAKLRSTVIQQASRLTDQEARLALDKQLQLQENALRLLNLGARQYAIDHNGEWPPTLDALLTEVGADANGQLPEGVPLSEFELFPQPRRITDEEPHLILIRRKQPLVQSDGTPLHLYGMVGGDVAKVPEDQAADFERLGTASGEAP